MKRLMVVASVLVLLGGSLSLLAGCGGDTGKAKAYMQQGDKIQAELQTGFTELTPSMKKVFANATDEASKKAGVEEVKALTAGLNAKADEAIAEYGKIEGLSGVEDYKKYAALVIEEDKSVKDIMAATDKYFDELLPMMSLDNVTEEQVTEVTTTYQKEMEELTKKLGEAENEANQLKKDKKL